MAKKLSPIRMEPRVLDALKELSAEYKIPLGDVLEGLVEFTKSYKYIEDPEFHTRFENLLKISLANTGTRAGWVGGRTYRDIFAEAERKQKEEMEEEKK